MFLYRVIHPTSNVLASNPSSRVIFVWTSISRYCHDLSPLLSQRGLSPLGLDCHYPLELLELELLELDEELLELELDELELLELDDSELDDELLELELLELDDELDPVPATLGDNAYQYGVDSPLHQNSTDSCLPIFTVS